MKAIIIVLLLWANCLYAQKNIECDTTPVWVVYLDSVRVFAGYPGVDMRTAVLPGWRVVSGKNEKFFDTNGVEFDPEMVLFSKRRKITHNAFRQ
jgi:hypothetical protein